MSNFAFLQEDKNLESFSSACLEAEKSILVSPATTAILSRRALELAVRWVYSFDYDLKLPYQDNVSSLIHNNSFVGLIGYEMLELLKYIIKLGNVAVHTNADIKRDEAILSLHNLHQFVSWINYCYGNKYKDREFNEKYIPMGKEDRTRPDELWELYEKLSSKDNTIDEIRQQNKSLINQLTEKRKSNNENYNFKIDKISKVETKKRYIDIESKLEEWNFNKDVVEEGIKGIGILTSQALKGCCNFTKNVMEKKKQLDEDRRTLYEQKIRAYIDCENPNPIEVFKIYKKILSSSMMNKYLKEEAISNGVSVDFMKNISCSTISNALISNLNINHDFEAGSEASKELIKIFDKIIYNQVETDKKTLLELIGGINVILKITSIDD